MQNHIILPSLEHSNIFVQCLNVCWVDFSECCAVFLGAKQEYPTEPLDKIPALQGRIALAGKLNTGYLTCCKIYINILLAVNLCCNAGSC